jgi:hypothetical protein
LGEQLGHSSKVLLIPRCPVELERSRHRHIPLATAKAHDSRTCGANRWLPSHHAIINPRCGAFDTRIP